MADPHNGFARGNGPEGADWAGDDWSRGPGPDDAMPDIDIMEYVRLLWARKWIIIGILVATVVFASAWSMTQPKLYRATTKVIVEPSSKINNNQFDAFVNYWQLDRYIADQIQVLNTERLGQRVVDRLGLA